LSLVWPGFQTANFRRVGSEVLLLGTPTVLLDRGAPLDDAGYRGGPTQRRSPQGVSFQRARCARGVPGREGARPPRISRFAKLLASRFEPEDLCERTALPVTTSPATTRIRRSLSQDRNVPVESAGGFAISMLCMIHSIFACKKLKISTVLVTKRVCIESCARADASGATTRSRYVATVRRFGSRTHTSARLDTLIRQILVTAARLSRAGDYAGLD
jgi:hypothetical protein